MRFATTATSAAVAALVCSVAACSGAEEPLVLPAAVAGEDAESRTGDVPVEAIGASAESDAESETSEAPSEAPRPTPEGADAAASQAPRATSPREGTTEGAPPAEGAPAASAPSGQARATEPRATLHTSGRHVLDTCGQVFVTRGVEQIFGEQLPQGNDWLALIEEISKSGVNAVRILASTDTLDVGDVDALLDVVAEHGMVGYITPYGDEGMRWLEQRAVRDMLAAHEKYIIIDAFGEPTFDDRERFVAESTDALRKVRSWGYRVPLTVTANQFGRDLPSLFELGPQILAADPLGNTIFGWQAYWGSSGYYHQHYGMSFEQALQAIARAPFPVQLGLDRVTDFPSSETADFSALMAGTQEHGVGWLWWDWYNPYGNENNLTENGSAARLTATGETVIEGHAASVRNTSQRVCVR